MHVSPSVSQGTPGGSPAQDWTWAWAGSAETKRTQSRTVVGRWIALIGASLGAPEHPSAPTSLGFSGTSVMYSDDLICASTSNQV